MSETPKKPELGDIPTSLKSFAQKILGLAHTKDSHEKLKEYLKKTIRDAKLNGTLGTTDWEKFPIPEYQNFTAKPTISQENTLSSMPKPLNSNISFPNVQILPQPPNTSFPGAMPMFPTPHFPPSTSKFPLFFASQTVATKPPPPPPNPQPPTPKFLIPGETIASDYSSMMSNSQIPHLQNKKLKKKNEITGKKKKKNTFIDLPPSPDDKEKLIIPRKRQFSENFSMKGEVETEEVNSASSKRKKPSENSKFNTKIVQETTSLETETSKTQQIIPSKKEKLVGLCQTLEKSYYRLGEVADPKEVRPLEILEQALVLVLKKYQKEHAEYIGYLKTQLKSIRQDLRVQMIENEFTVKVYETHAQIALQERDLEEFNQCQTQLWRNLYNRGIKGEFFEFAMYRILYLTFMEDHLEIVAMFQDISDEIKTHPFVQHAIRVKNAFDEGNFYMILNDLYEESPKHGKALFDCFLENYRKASLKKMVRGLKQSTIPLNYAISVLGLHRDRAKAKKYEEELLVIEEQQIEGSFRRKEKIVKCSDTYFHMQELEKEEEEENKKKTT